MSSRSLLAPVTINGTDLAGIFANRAGPAREILRRGVNGNFHVTTQSARKRWAACEVKTLDLGVAIGILTGSTDLPAVKMNGSTGYKGYYGLLDSGLPAFAAGSVHETRTALTGTMWMESLDWQEGGDAEMTLKGLFGSSDGSVEPLVYSTGALPSILATALPYDLTSLTVNGATVVDVASFGLRFDPKFSTKRHPGSVLARDVFNDGNPIDIALSMTLGDLSVMRGAGGAGGTGNVAAVFTKRANNGGLGSATFTIAVNGEWVLPEDESAAIGGEVTGQVLVYPRYDGSNKPVSWAVG